MHKLGPRQNRIPAIPGVDQPIPLLSLGRRDELEQVRRVHPGGPIEVGLAADIADLDPPVPAMLDQPPRNVSLESRLVRRVHVDVPGSEMEARPRVCAAVASCRSPVTTTRSSMSNEVAAASWMAS